MKVMMIVVVVFFQKIKAIQVMKKKVIMKVKTPVTVEFLKEKRKINLMIMIMIIIIILKE